MVDVSVYHLLSDDVEENADQTEGKPEPVRVTEDNIGRHDTQPGFIMLPEKFRGSI